MTEYDIFPDANAQLDAWPRQEGEKKRDLPR